MDTKLKGINFKPHCQCSASAGGCSVNKHTAFERNAGLSRRRVFVNAGSTTVFL